MQSELRVIFRAFSKRSLVNRFPVDSSMCCAPNSSPNRDALVLLF